MSAEAGWSGCISRSLPFAVLQHFVYYQSMDVRRRTDTDVSSIAAAIGEPARALMLFSLMDGHARSSTELAVLASVSPSTASVHLHRLKQVHLVKILVQGKHRFYSLEGPEVASALEGLRVLAGASRDDFVPSTPDRLRTARTCYDHLAGKIGVSLHDRFHALGWLSTNPNCKDNIYSVTPQGTKAFEALGIDIGATRAQRRRFACPCLDWSERRPHIGGALGAAVLNIVLKRKWLVRELDSRALHVTSLGRRELRERFGVQA
jgi:DNA-binding transcriptional ArsR family regulator